MTRTTISLDEGLLRELQRMARERNTTVSVIVREALADKVATTKRKPASLGIGASAHRDTARRSGDLRPEPRSWR